MKNNVEVFSDEKIDLLLNDFKRNWRKASDYEKKLYELKATQTRLYEDEELLNRYVKENQQLRKERTEKIIRSIIFFFIVLYIAFMIVCWARAIMNYFVYSF